VKAAREPIARKRSRQVYLPGFNCEGVCTVPAYYYEYYYYQNPNDGEKKPLQECPKCHADLHKDNSVAAGLIVAGCSVWPTTKLSANGRLEDFEDHPILTGFHSETRCNNCQQQLIDYERQVTFSS
jgi:hypothetical protein